LVGHVEEERRREERREDVAHPVEAEALAPLVRDDERDLSWKLRLRGVAHAPWSVSQNRVANRSPTATTSSPRSAMYRYCVSMRPIQARRAANGGGEPGARSGRAKAATSPR